jgi:1,4-dihydroxy-2-naphthoate octaprenyltransferase
LLRIPGVQTFDLTRPHTYNGPWILPLARCRAAGETLTARAIEIISHEEKTMVKHILGPMRLPFLVLTPACVLVGVGTAIWTEGPVSPLQVLLVLLGATAAHISVNAYNEYFDFRSGLDARTRRTPFSGGSGTLPANPALARYALTTAVVAMVISGAIGLYYLYISGWALLPLGILGLLTIFAYTPWLAHDPLLCLIAPGLGFGPLMVMGTHFALTGTYGWTPFVASLVPFFLVSDLLLLNQFPDVEADRSVGRRHYPIVIGRRASSLIYGAFLLCTYLAIALGAAFGVLPPATLLGLLTLPLAVPAGIRAYRHAEAVDQLIPALGLNVIINITTPVLVAIGLFIG